MKTQKIETPVGVIQIDEKISEEDKDIFIGDIMLSFYPQFPEKKNAVLKCFSLDYPRNGNSNIDHYEWLFSWHDKETGQNLHYMNRVRR